MLEQRPSGSTNLAPALEAGQITFEELSMPMNRRDFIAGLALLGLAAGSDANASAERERADWSIVRPKKLNGLMANPGMGWQTTDRVLSELNPANHEQRLPSTSAYLKYYWSELQPGPKTFDMEKVARDAAAARACGQRITARLMIVDERTSAPSWLKKLGIPGCRFLTDDGSLSKEEYQELKRKGGVWTPDFNNPKFIEFHAAVLAEFRKAFGDALEAIDIGSVGLWGEWHFSNTEILSADEGFPSSVLSSEVPMPEQAVRNALIDQYRSTFEGLPMLAHAQDKVSLAHAISRGAGWRGDCFGNDFQHRKLYPTSLSYAGARDAWKQAPVAFEICYRIDQWPAKGWVGRVLDEKLAFGLEHHASYVNTKNRRVPEELWPAIQQFFQKVGYRLALQEVRHPREVARDEPLPLAMEWENTGVAPPYGDYMLAARLQGAASTPSIQPLSSTKGWLPGRFELRDQVTTRGLPAGRYSLALAIIPRNGARPVVQLANEGAEGKGAAWFPVSEVTIR